MKQQTLRQAWLWRWWQWTNPENWGLRIARHVPAWLRYWVVIWVWAQATCAPGVSANPDQVRVIECLERLWPTKPEGTK